jgi:nitrate ABC transporter ATP-binding subunit
MRKYLELWQLAKSYPSPAGPPVPVVSDFSMAVAEGEFVSLIGHSGCGKSTVLSMVAGLTEASAGVMTLAGRHIEGPGPDRGMVFQSPSLLPWLSAIDNVLLGLAEVMPRASQRQRRERAQHYLELVGLGHALDQRPAELSAGMRQRVGLARAFALTPRLLLLDEPFGMLDSITRVEMQLLLAELGQREARTTLMVTHDVDEAIFLSDRVVMMTTGPSAKVGDVVPVPFPRPRDRQALLTQPSWLALRERLLGFLEEQPRAA